MAADPLTYFDDERFDATAARHARAFIRQLRVERGYSENTVRAYAIDLRSYLDWAARAQVDPLQVNSRQFRRYLAELHAAGYTAKTVSRRLSAVRSLFSYLNVEGLCAVNPAAAAATPKVDRELPRKTATGDVEALLGVCDTSTPEGLRDQCFLELLYASGARIAELADLAVHDVNLSSSELRLFGKGSKERVVPIYPVAVRTTSNYLNMARPKLLGDKRSDALFISTRGNAMTTTTLRRVFKRCAAVAGLDASLHPHDLRHAFATDMLEGGADMRSVQELLGHASLSTTQIYTHLSLDRMKDVYKDTHPRA